MYLTKTEQIPSYNVSNLWINLTNHISNVRLKNKAYKLEFTAGDAICTITNEAMSFNQKDKLIFEMVLYQYQQRKYPDTLIVNMDQLCLDMNYEVHKKHINYLFDRLKLFSMFRFVMYNHKTERVIELDFSDIFFTIDKEVCVNFNNQKLTPLKILFNPKNNPKKYILPLKGEYELLIAEFLQLKTTSISKTDKHPFKYRYRNFKLIDILKHLRLEDEYNHAIEFFNKAKEKQIKDTITRTLRKLTKYGLENNIPIPKYRYSNKTEMYEIKDFNYPDQRTDREILLGLED